jgi:hypothetical protein
MRILLCAVLFFVAIVSYLSVKTVPPTCVITKDTLRIVDGSSEAFLIWNSDDGRQHSIFVRTGAYGKVALSSSKSALQRNGETAVLTNINGNVKLRIANKQCADVLEHWINARSR